MAAKSYFYATILFLYQKSIKGSSIKYERKIFRKINICNPLIRTRPCAYQGVRNVSFSESFVYVLNGWPPINQSINQYFFIKMYLRETLGILCMCVREGPVYFVKVIEL